MDSQEKKRKVKQIIQENLYMILSTAIKEQPWISPVFYAVDENYQFYWYSRKDTKHSENIAKNPHISVVIFNSSPKESTGEAVYMQGQAKEVTQEELPHAINVYAEKATKGDQEKQQICTIEDFLNDSILRMYKFIPNTIYTNTAENWNGKWIDKRVEVKLFD